MLDTVVHQGLPCLTLDAGDLFFPGGDLTPATRAKQDRSAHVLARTLAPLGVRALAVGEGDLARGPEELERLGRISGCTLLCSNLRYRDGPQSASVESVGTEAGSPRFKTGPGRGSATTSEPPGISRASDRPFAEELVLDLPGIRIGVFALLSRSLGVETTYPALVLEDPVSAATRLISSFEGRTDLVLLLAHMPRSEAESLLGRVPGVDAAILGHGPEILSEPAFAGGALLLAANCRGQVVGRLDLHPSSPGQRLGGRARLRRAPGMPAARTNLDRSGDSVLPQTRTTSNLGLPAPDPMHSRGSGEPASPVDASDTLLFSMRHVLLKSDFSEAAGMVAIMRNAGAEFDRGR